MDLRGVGDNGIGPGRWDGLGGNGVGRLSGPLNGDGGRHVERTGGGGEDGKERWMTGVPRRW